MTLPDCDFVAVAQARFDALANYQVTLRSTSAGAGAEPVEVVYGYRKPGFVRMDFVHPHAGATLVFNPDSGQVALWPFGIDTFPRLALSPDNPMIRSPQGHRVDESDIGALLAKVHELQQHGDTQIVGAETLGSCTAAYVIVTGGPGHAVSGVCRYALWFDLSHGLPIKVVSEGESREPIETVLMDDLRIDVPESQLRPFA